MSRRSDVGAERYDEWFELLADELRRRILLELSSRAPPPATLSIPGDLARSDEDPDVLHLHLDHVHLPKLDRADVIDWDRDADVVSPGSAFERLRPLLRAVEPLADVEPGEE